MFVAVSLWYRSSRFKQWLGEKHYKDHLLERAVSNIVAAGANDGLGKNSVKNQEVAHTLPHPGPINLIQINLQRGNIDEMIERISQHEKTT